MSKGTFYFHFASKEDILVTLVQQWAAELSEGLVNLAADSELEGGSLRPLIDRLLAGTAATWEPRLVLEFISQAEQSNRVGEALTSAQGAWRAATVRLFSKARRVGAVDDSLSPDAVASALLTLRNGLIMQDCLPGANRGANIRAATKAALAIVRPPQSMRKAS